EFVDACATDAKFGLRGLERRLCLAGARAALFICLGSRLERAELRLERSEAALALRDRLLENLDLEARLLQRRSQLRLLVGGAVACGLRQLQRELPELCFRRGGASRFFRGERELARKSLAERWAIRLRRLGHPLGVGTGIPPTNLGPEPGAESVLLCN